jgi:hypothetical protein
MHINPSFVATHHLTLKNSMQEYVSGGTPSLNKEKERKGR